MGFIKNNLPLIVMGAGAIACGLWFWFKMRNIGRNYGNVHRLVAQHKKFQQSYNNGFNRK